VAGPEELGVHDQSDALSCYRPPSGRGDNVGYCPFRETVLSSSYRSGVKTTSQRHLALA